MDIIDSSEPTSKRKVNIELPLLNFIPPSVKNKHFYENGLSKLIPRLTVKVHDGIEDCFYLWDLFSPKNSLFQLWDFRYSWYQGYGYRPLFFTLYEGKKPMAVLPLWYNEEDKIFEWFGGYWPEDNVFFVKDQEFLPLLLKIASVPLHLNAILPESIPAQSKSLGIVEDQVKYMHDIKGINTIDILLAQLSKKHRHNIRKEFTRINSHSVKIEWLEGQPPGLLEELKKLSIARFTQKREDPSAYEDRRRYSTFEHIYKNQGSYKIITLSVKVQNHFAVIDIIGIYRNNYYLLTGANDTARFPGIGVYVTYIEFVDAIRRRMGMIDVMQEDNNWKHKYFSSKRMLKFEKKI